MSKLNLPEVELKYKDDQNKKWIFDEIRKKYLVLTPEEEVRQTFIHFLVKYRKVPPGLIAIEKGLLVNNMKRRTDIVIYSKYGSPIAVVECKAPHIKITQTVFEQIARYNMTLRVPLLIITNGITNYCCKIEYLEPSFSFIKDIPNYEDMLCLANVEGQN
ncbi:MAG: type I restriction enzyme HsdR N-terminal domain-containing protein [Hyphomicrobiales bacterium]